MPRERLASFVRLIAVLAVSAIAAGCQSAGGARSSAGLAAARDLVAETIGHDPVAEFEKNKREGTVPFYSHGSYAYGEHFPGLSQEDADLWIGRRLHPYTRKFWDDPAPFFIDAGFTMKEYWRAMDDYLTTYNSLVLAFLNEGHNKSPEPTRDSVTPAAGAPGAPPSGAAHL